MAQIIRKETRKRSAFGKVVKWMFILFNLLMVFWLVAGMSAASDSISNAGSSAEQAGGAIGATIGAGLVITVWALGDIILGIFVLLTRGQKIIVEETVAE